jgi:hypothetical protein
MGHLPLPVLGICLVVLVGKPKLSCCIPDLPLGPVRFLCLCSVVPVGLVLPDTATWCVPLRLHWQALVQLH